MSPWKDFPRQNEAPVVNRETSMRSTIATTLPIIPQVILRRHHVDGPHDTRFRAAARLLQSLWRDNQALDAGVHRTRRGGRRKLGSRLTPDAAAAGRAFLHPSIAAVARYELAYRESGALIAEERLMTNLLSSSGLVFNLFAPLRLDRQRAAAILRSLLPKADIAKVLHVAFEHSPGRNEAAFTRDKTAFDVAVVYQRSDGGKGLVAVEVKYADDMGDLPPGDLGHYDNLAQAAGLFRAPPARLLQSSALSQLAREHLLAQASVMNGVYDEAHFLLIAPRLNHQVTRAAGLYAANLASPLPGATPFSFIELEQVIDAYRRGGDADYAAALEDRYARWDQIDALVREALTRPKEKWALMPPAPKRRMKKTQTALKQLRLTAPTSRSA